MFFIILYHFNQQPNDLQSGYKKCPLLRTQSDNNDDQCLPMKSFEGLEMNSAIGSGFSTAGPGGGLMYGHAWL